MKFDRRHARGVAKPSACILAESLAPQVTGRPRAALVRWLEEHIETAIHAYCEFHPTKLPVPSRN